MVPVFSDWILSLRVYHVKYGQLVQENNGFLNVNIVPAEVFSKQYGITV